MAPRKSQSASLTSPSKTLVSSSGPSKVSLITSDIMVTLTLDVSELPSLPIESSSSSTTIEKDIENPPSNSTDISDAPTKSGDGSDTRTATEDPATTPNTFSHSHQIAAPVNGTVIEDPSSDIPASDESTSEDPKAATPPSSNLATFGRTSSPPPPSESASPDRAGNGGLANPSPPPNLVVSPSGTHNTVPLPFSSATSFTSEGTVYVMSTFASTFETTLPNGSVMTTAKDFTTLVPTPSAEANVNANGEGERPRQNPGPFNKPPVSSETFFQRPAAATGVFVVVLLVVGSLVWMFLIIKRHRRQIAAAAKERKRPSYMYGSTGISPRGRRSCMSYESHNWPQRFERTSVDNVPNSQAAQAPAPAPAPDPAIVLQRRPGYGHTITDFEHPQIGAVFASSGSSIPTHHPVLRSQSQRGNPILGATSPPTPPQRLWSPPARTFNVAAEDVYYRREYANAVPSGSNQHSPISLSGLLVPSVHMPLSRNTSNQPSRRRASPSTSFHHPYSVASTSPPVTPQFPANIESTSRNVVDRRLSDIPSYASAENLFRSSAYIVPSPTPSAELQDSTERLSNPFNDAESPPHSPVAFTYVRDRGATQTVVLERGVSIRRNDSLRNRPEHTQSSYLPQGPNTAEWGSSGSDAASSSIHIDANASSRAALGYRVMERSVAYGSESISTAETSAANSVHRIGSLDSEELFYNPAFAVASPVRDKNPQFPEIRG